MKVAVVVLADTEAAGDHARLVNALGTVQECLEADDDVRILFDGAGTQWPLVLENRAHPMSDVWKEAKDRAVVCSHCASQFDAEEDILRTGIETTEATGHFSIRGLMGKGYEVLTF